MTDSPLPPGAEQWPLGRLLGMAARAVQTAWNAALAEQGLTHAGIIVLDLIRHSAVNQTELAHRADVTVQTMSRTLEKLERDGHIRREADPADNRSQLVKLTAAGLAVWEAAHRLEELVMPAVSDPGALRRALLEVLQRADQPADGSLSEPG